MFNTWVKNVYSLRMTSGIEGGDIPLSYTPPTLAYSRIRVQTLSFTHVSTMFSAALSTLKNSYLHLLNSHLYPVSTVPTIKKKKEIKERNS